MEKENKMIEEEIQDEETKNKPQKEKKPKKNKQIEELTEKAKLLEEEALRAKADLINYRKRKDEETSNLLKYANTDILLSLLPIIDNFERALKKENLTEEAKSYFEGVELIYNSLLKLLEDNEVKEIKALGEEFDPKFHQSVASKKDEEKPQGIVLEVYQKGYTYKDKVLRPAMVIINE